VVILKDATASPRYPDRPRPIRRIFRFDRALGRTAVHAPPTGPAAGRGRPWALAVSAAPGPRGPGGRPVIAAGSRKPAEQFADIDRLDAAAFVSHLPEDRRLRFAVSWIRANRTSPARSREARRREDERNSANSGSGTSEIGESTAVSSLARRQDAAAARWLR
jgi:hypothetical protein